jgi:hypothetical protein
MKMRDRLRQTAFLALASVGALSLGGHAFAATDVFNLTGNVANFQSPTYSGTTSQFNDNYLQLDGVSQTTVSDGDSVTVNVGFGQSYTIPASQSSTYILLYLQGNGFDGTSVVTSGAFTFYNQGQAVGMYDSSAGTSGQIASFAVLSPPNNQALTFDSLSDNFTVTALDQPASITGAAFDYQLVSPVSAAPEPSAWLLMFVGVGAVGLMLRRAKTAAGPARDAFLA